MATSVSVRAAVDDGGSADKHQKVKTMKPASCGRQNLVVLYRYPPSMMLNIRGLRMAGQISLRKTKPLEEKKKKATS